MKKLLTSLLFGIALMTSSYGQTKTGKISGTVIDGNTKTIESATITLLRVKDSAIVKMSVADRTGKFQFDGVPAGNYFVSITAVGHNKGYSENFQVTDEGNSISLKTIELVPQAKSIGEVTVTARKPLIEQKLDRTIINVEASVTNV
ncbi:MAG TPA: carboxypeptidase-like regulatory domain-containing protein, partial [Chitinophagaceae bacterium]